MKLKNSKWYQKSDPYFKAEFDVQVIIGAASLKFQTLDRRGVLSQDHNIMNVDWLSSPIAEQVPPAGIELDTETTYDKDSEYQGNRFQNVRGFGVGVRFANGLRSGLTF